MLGDRHQDVGDLVFGFAARLCRDRRQIGVQLGIGHGHAAVDFPLTYALDGHFTPDVLAVFRVGNPFPLQQPPEFFRGHLVFLRNAQDRALDHLVVHANAGLLRVLQHRALGDEPFQHLLLERISRGGLYLGGGHLGKDDAFLLVHVVLRHRLVVDHDNDAIELHGSRARGGRRRRARRARFGRRGADAG